MASPVISVRNLLVSESDGVADFAVILSEASASPVIVSYNTGNATAANGSDFTAASGTLTFAPGTTVQHVLVPIIDNAVAEPTESFFFNLFTPTNAAIGNTSAVATIVDNDGVSGTPVMSVRDQVVDEAAGTVTFAVVLDRPSVSAVTVSYTTAAGTAGAADFSPVSGTLAFAPGDVVQDWSRFRSPTMRRRSRTRRSISCFPRRSARRCRTRGDGTDRRERPASSGHTGDLGRPTSWWAKATALPNSSCG